MHHSIQYVFARIPFVKYIIPFIAGIISCYYSSDALSPLIISTSVIIASLALISALRSGQRYRLRYLRSALIYGLLYCSGYIITTARAGAPDQINTGTSQLTLIRLDEVPQYKPASIKCNATVKAIIHKETKQVSARVIIYLEKDSSLFEQLQLGRYLWIRSSFQAISNSKNPGAFNYQEYCARQGIFFQSFVKAKDVRPTSANDASWLDRMISNSRQYILEELRSGIKDEKALAIAEALLIGYKQDLDKDLVQAYSNTGVVHIIAISGLHLALIYSLLLKIVNAIAFIRKSKWKWLIVLLGLWGFSLLSGASPSVLRAAVMFSFLIGAELFNRKQSPLNTLAASAFFLLVYDPYLLWDVGFQLSYTAALSIMLLYKPIYDRVYFRNRSLDVCWQLNAVTIAAQVFTLPLVVYHFHQFPNMFLFTNLVAVPLSGLILYTEIIFLIFSSTFLSAYISIALEKMIVIMNQFIVHVDGFRFAVMDHIDWNIPLAIFFYMIIISFVVFFFFRRNKWAFLSLLSLLAFLILDGYYSFQHSTQQKLIVYNVPERSAIDIINGDSAYFIGDPDLVRTASLLNFHIKPSRTVHRTPDVSYSFIYSRSLKIKDQIIDISTGRLDPRSDITVITQNPRSIGLNTAKKGSIVIADATNARWKIKEWKKQAEHLHLRFHSVAEDGAFIMDL